MRFKNLAAVIGLLFGGIATSAVAAPTFYNTGVDNSGNPLVGGAADLHYTFSNGTTLTSAVALSDSNLWYEWVRPSDARWLYNADQPDSGYRGWATFTTTVDLAGYDPQSAKLMGQWAADQYGYITLNGIDTGISVPDRNWDGKLTSFTIQSGFKTGSNTLAFHVYLPDGGDGLVVSNATLSAALIPEPQTYSMFIIGLGLMGFIVYRRKPA
jgi:hypothetical protein